MRRLDTAGYRFDAGDAPQADRAAPARAAEGHAARRRPRRDPVPPVLDELDEPREGRASAACSKALPEAAGDAALLGGIELDLAWVDIYQGDLSSALAHGRASVEHAHDERR